MDRGAWRATVDGVAKSQTWPSDRTAMRSCRESSHTALYRISGSGGQILQLPLNPLPGTWEVPEPLLWWSHRAGPASLSAPRWRLNPSPMAAPTTPQGHGAPHQRCSSCPLPESSPAQVCPVSSSWSGLVVISSTPFALHSKPFLWLLFTEVSWPPSLFFILLFLSGRIPRDSIKGFIFIYFLYCFILSYSPQ